MVSGSQHLKTESFLIMCPLSVAVIMIISCKKEKRTYMLVEWYDWSSWCAAKERDLQRLLVLVELQVEESYYNSSYYICATIPADFGVSQAALLPSSCIVMVCQICDCPVLSDQNVKDIVSVGPPTLKNNILKPNFNHPETSLIARHNA